jgi:hypothetical protein
MEEASPPRDEEDGHWKRKPLVRWDGEKFVCRCRRYQEDQTCIHIRLYRREQDVVLRKDKDYL